MRKIAFLLFLILPWLLTAQTLTKEESKARLTKLGNALQAYDEAQLFNIHPKGLIVVRQKDQYGLVSDEGRPLLPCEYDYIVMQKHHDLWAAVKDSVCSFFDGQLNLIFQSNNVDYLFGEADDYFHNGKRVCQQNDLHGIVDTTGNTVLPFQYPYLEIFNDDLMLVTNFEDRFSGAGAINMQGDTVIPFVYEAIENGGNNLVAVRKDKRQGFLSPTGKCVIPCEYDDMSYFATGEWPTYFSQGYASMKKDGKWGLIDTLGRTILPFQYENRLLHFTNGLVVVNRDERFGIMDVRGRNKIPIQYNNYLWFDPGNGLIMFKDSTNCDIYSTTGRMIGSYDEFGFDIIDYTNYTNMYPVQKNGKWGLLNKDFKLVVPCQYEQTRGYEDYGLVTLSDGQSALVDSTGAIVFKGPYDEIGKPTINGWFAVSQEAPDCNNIRVGFADIYGNTTFDVAKPDTDKMRK